MKTHEVRKVEKQEVEKMLSCKRAERGCFVFYYERCGRYELIPFRCNSRLCSPCGKRYTDKWAIVLAEKIMPKIVHRHITFSMPEILWKYTKEDRNLQKIENYSYNRLFYLTKTYYKFEMFFLRLCSNHLLS